MACISQALKIKEGDVSSLEYANLSEVDLKDEVEINSLININHLSLKNLKSKFKVNPLREEQCFATFEIEGIKECDYFDLNIMYKIT